MVYTETERLGRPRKRESGGLLSHPCFLWLQRSAQLASWPAGHWHRLPLCVKTSEITYVLLPDVAPAPVLSKWEVLSWCHLPNLVQRTEATWPADQGSAPVSRTVSPFAETIRLGGVQKSRSLVCVCVCVCVCVFKLH